MRIVRFTAGWIAVLAATLFAAGPLHGQYSTKVPGTLRWGSGHVDVPSAGVLPHMAIVGTYSGFLVDIDDNPIIDDQGRVVGVSGPFEKWYSDATVGFGLFDRVEVGAVLHSLDDEGSGNVVGGFGQIAFLRPAPDRSGIGLAGGVRASTSPKYRDDLVYAANRLGIPDANFRQSYGAGSEQNRTHYTFYGVASAFLKGFQSDIFPDHDFTFTLGWGDGLFHDGESLRWYSFASAKGFFGGATLHMALTEKALLNLSGDYNGFDVNIGAQLDLNGVRFGAHYLGTNYLGEASIYRSPKFGALASIAICPSRGGVMCRAKVIPWQEADTIRLPAPLPDTVIVTREIAPSLPTGQATEICLATGENISVLVTAQGDTLVGPSRSPIRALRQAGVVFAGEYAQGRVWFSEDQPITFDGGSFQKSGGEIRLDCVDVQRVGDYQGVPLLVQRDAETPYLQLYVPVRPGVWQMYENLRGTRG